MTQNVEIVRRFLSAEVDEALPYADPGIVWNPIEELPTQGHDAVRASLAHWKAEWDDYELVPEEFVDRGDRVVVTVRLEGAVAGAGLRSTPASTTSTRSATARSSAWTSSQSGPKPSKPRV